MRQHLQVLNNVMASIGKSDGGIRTVAIATTLYRMLMQRDSETVPKLSNDKAFRNDSAACGSSAITAAEDRAFSVEIAKLEGVDTIKLLWILKNIFDSIGIPTLIEEARNVGYPLKVPSFIFVGASCTQAT